MTADEKNTLSTKKEHVAIIGAGATGLAAACALCDSGIPVTLLEAEHTIGGLTSETETGTISLERIYHHMFTSDNTLERALSRYLPKSPLCWYKPHNALYQGGTLYPFTTPGDLLRFAPLPFPDRLRTGLLILLSRYLGRPDRLDKTTAKTWLTRWGGTKAFHSLWNPLLRAKFDRDADAVSGTWIWNKFRLRAASRSDHGSGEMLGYPDGGFFPLLQAMGERIKSSGGQLKTGACVTTIKRTDEGNFRLSWTTDNKEWIFSDFSQVLFTGAPEMLFPMLEQSTVQLLKTHPMTADAFGQNAIRHKANLCMLLTLKKSLSPYYWLTIADTALPFVVCVEHTRLVGTAPYGHHHVYLSRYLDVSDPLWRETDDVISEKFLEGLQTIFPSFQKQDLLSRELTRSPFAQPVMLKGSQSALLPLKLPVPGLWISSMAQIWPEDRGLNHALFMGERVARGMSGAEPGQKDQITV